MNPEITLKLPLQDVQLIGQALGKLPLEISMSVFLKVKDQTESQLQPQGESHE
jgi:hypothetical protein